VESISSRSRGCYTLIMEAARTPLFFVLLSLLLALPVLTHAQGDLQATVRAAIASDPRTAGLSEAQIEAMVAALSQQAQAEGVTPQDIEWRPSGEVFAAAGGSEFCAPYPEYLCVMSASYGFFGPDYLLPLWFLVLSLLFLLVNAVRRHHHRLHTA